MERQSRVLATVVACAWTLGALSTAAHGDTLVVAADGQTRAFVGHRGEGDRQSLGVNNVGPGPENRALLRFDLSSLPDGASVDKAVLRLWASDVGHAGTVQVAPVIGPWNEKTQTATHVQQPAVGPPAASFSVARGSQDHFVSVEITDLVRDWLSGAQANNGVALLGSVDAPVDAKFDSKENVLTSHAPEVEVALAGPQGPSGPQGPAGPEGPPGPAGGIASLDALAGASCTRNGQMGSVSVQMAADGTISLRCLLSGPPATPCTDPVQCCIDTTGQGVCAESPCDTGLPIDDADPRDAAKALGLCRTAAQGTGFGVTAAAFTRADGTVIQATSQFGILSSFGANVHPKEGSSLFVLSSGRARTPSQAGACGGATCTGTGSGTAPPGFPQQNPRCPGSTAINDDVALKLTLRAPANALGFAFAFKFYSFEYPDWVCSAFNDQFVVLMDPPPQGSVNGNIVFDSMHNPVSVNNAFFEVCQAIPNYPCPLGTTDLVGTGFDTWGAKPAGGTGWLQASAPVQGGQEFTLRFILWDAGDQAYDSTVLLDQFRWLLTPTTTTTNP
jgi:hypothetical protein